MADTQTRKLVDAITGAWRTRAIYEGVRSGLIDNLGDTPVSAQQLADRLDLDAPTVMRILRALGALGLSAQASTDSFTITDTGARLKTGASGSLRGMAMLWGDRIWKSLETIGDTLRTGEPGWGNGNFDALHADPVESDIFNRAMAEQSGPIARAFAKTRDLAGFTSILDVGGGYGAVLIEILRANPHLEGAVYDLELIGDGASRYLQESGVGDRGGFRGGDFFSRIPGGADCIVLKYILHDWADADCARILANCRAALETGATLMVLERIVPERIGEGDESVARTDLVMMPISGKERTLDELGAMLGEAGFSIDAVTPLVDSCWAIEGRAV